MSNGVIDNGVHKVSRKSLEHLSASSEFGKTQKSNLERKNILHYPADLKCQIYWGEDTYPQ